MDRISLLGLISKTVTDVVNLTWQLECLLELGNHVGDSIRMTDGENRDFLRAVRDNAWALDRSVRGCEPDGEIVRHTLQTLVQDIVEGKLNEALEDMDWEKHNLVTHDDLSDYATESYVDNLVEDLPCEDKVREIIDEVVESLEVISQSTRVRRGY